MFGLGGSEILVILIVAILFISPDKIPEIAQWLGRTVWKVKHTAEEFRREVAIPSLGLDQIGMKDEIKALRNLKSEIKQGLESPMRTLGGSLLDLEETKEDLKDTEETPAPLLEEPKS